jgi:hypothetical protein
MHAVAVLKMLLTTQCAGVFTSVPKILACWILLGYQVWTWFQTCSCCSLNLILDLLLLFCELHFRENVNSFTFFSQVWHKESIGVNIGTFFYLVGCCYLNVVWIFPS